MKKFFIVFAMFMALSVMPVSAQSATPKVIPSVSSLIISPKQFRYEGKSSMVTISEDKSSANVYDSNLDLARSFTLQLNTTPISSVSQQYVNGQWVDTSSSGSSMIYDFGHINYYDYDESSESTNCDFTQTLFNNDEKYEYIVPVVDPNAEEVSVEQDYNGDGVPDYRSVRKGVITGLKVINEDGTVLTTLEGNQISFRVCKYGNKFYLITTSQDPATYSTTYNFYALDKEASGVHIVKRIQAASDRIFTLDGREHSELQHGLNIINGQKVIVK